ncbi:MAG TPA: patatin-like phospholipase family protein [Chitinophagaceae bacterium]
MPLFKETKRLLYYKDLFDGSFWRYLVQSLWLFFPPLIFVVLAYFCFWHITQGKDLMAIALEDDKGISYVFACFILALVFWVYVTWYSTRLVAKAKDLQEGDQHHIWKAFQVHTPRILAFTCITVILLAFFQLDIPGSPYIDSVWAHLILLFSFSWYFLIFRFWERILRQRGRSKEAWLRFLERIRTTAYTVMLLWVIATISVTSLHKPLLSFWILTSLLLIIQTGMVLLLLIRREISEARSLPADDEAGPVSEISPKSRLWKKFKYIITRENDRLYFRGFNIVSVVAFAVYVAAIIDVKVAVTIGSFPFMLLAFGVLLGIGNIITLISVFVRFNFHLLIFALAVLIGLFVDPHFATIVKKEKLAPSFQKRQDLKEYFHGWLTDSSRKTSIDSSGQYEIYFVMANGGASRSGYWTAGILGALEDGSDGKFSRHLFCLSGASGGSVGTSTFFSLLRMKNKVKQKVGGKTPMTDASSEFLQSDFLTYTLAHMLGPDIIRHIIPLNFVQDRAAALAYSIEKAADTSNVLYDSFSVRLSSLITQKGKADYGLPILCINTTRMQDGSPGVISNIDMTDPMFNERIDVLSLLNGDQDMKLSTAVVLGASFPYVSPAGRINSKCDSCETTSCHYFVDGGYFDNSGAGVVNEMMIAMNDMLHNDSIFLPWKDKIKFRVIHISNTEPKLINYGKINPITNDLLAPVKTLLGSYGTQTTINDQRLKNFLYMLYKDSSHYTNIDLYEGKREIKYSMNWVISQRQLKAMIRTTHSKGGFLKESERMTNWAH